MKQEYRTLHTAFHSQDKLIPRIHSKQENRFSLPQLSKKLMLDEIGGSQRQKSKTQKNFFNGSIQGQQLLESQQQRAPLPNKDNKHFFKLVYKSQYSFRPTKINPRMSKTIQPSIQKKLGGPIFAFRSINQQQLVEPELIEKMYRRQIKYLDESHNLNESLTKEIGQILYGEGQKLKKDEEIAILEESENSFA